MTTLGELSFDVATALSLGARERQEDTVVADFPLGAPMGFAVLSDGMGGHACGDVASGIVATELFSELKLLSGDPEQMERAIGAVLQDAVTAANSCIRLYEDQAPNTEGMGATLVAPVIFGARLYWVSVGDSPLFLLRGGRLYRLNEDHSYAAQIDLMQARGLMDRDVAQNHPDRSALVSVLAGRKIAKVDCRAEPMTLKDGDIVLAASDGVHTLTDDQIVSALVNNRDKSGRQIGEALVAAVLAEACPDQDNLSLCIIKATRRGAGQNGPPARQSPQSSPSETGQVVQIDRRADHRTVRTIVSLTRKVGK
ncbi:PP2C family protein-serine/threonine phosphatase [Shimia sagamensis]|uniref:Serine/threonine protein phosphatase PrpC n=1 Tax=Shimia sagamensis TaxID=1566352 RepID=A0ABY1PE85_9RHOB|nr:protein phosphatase 2C domain-containing protein [Shimia sagamensis]SMP30996.1 Serine/threonine protein phosphatase PrpC [Shimia sagamensis]